MASNDGNVSEIGTFFSKRGTGRGGGRGRGRGRGRSQIAEPVTSSPAHTSMATTTDTGIDNVQVQHETDTSSANLSDGQVEVTNSKTAASDAENNPGTEGEVEGESKAESVDDDTESVRKSGKVEVVPVAHPSRQARLAGPSKPEKLREHSAQIRSIDVKNLPSTITDLFEGSNPDILSNAAASCSIDGLLKTIGIETLTSIQHAVLQQYFDNKAEQQKEKAGRSEINAAFMTMPDMTVVAGYGSGKTVAYALPVIDHVLSVKNCVNISIPARDQKFQEAMQGHELQTGSIYAVVICATRPQVEQTYQVFKALCEPLGLSVLEAHDYAATNTKRSNIIDIMQSKAHIVVCTPGRLLNLVFADVDEREVHPRYLVDPELKEDFVKQLYKAAVRPSFFSTTSVIVLDDAFELFTSASWQEDLLDLRHHLWPQCENDFGLISVSQVDILSDEYINLVKELDGTKGPGETKRGEFWHHWVKRSTRVSDHFLVYTAEKDKGKATTRFLHWSVDVKFTKDDFNTNSCDRPPANILNALPIKLDDKGRPMRILIIVGTKRGVNNVYGHVANMAGGKFANEVRCMHGDLEGAVIRQAHQEFVVDDARIMIATGGLAHGINFNVDQVCILFWGWQSKVTAESLVSYIATTGRLGREGHVSLFFWFNKADVDAFAKLLDYFHVHRPVGYSQARWCLEAANVLENARAMEKLTGEQVNFGSSLFEIAQWVDENGSNDFPTVVASPKNNMEEGEYEDDENFA